MGGCAPLRRLFKVMFPCAAQEFPAKITTASASAKWSMGSVCKSGAAGPPQLAVRDLCLAMEYGECFGLLGPNGA